MKNEIKIGLLGLVASVILIFGYKYLKGQNILEKSKTYYVVYDQVDMLDVSNPVLINGFKVGSVIDMNIDKEDANYIEVTIDVEGDISLPKETQAVLISTGVLGDKAISLEFDKLCESDCLEDGAKLDGISRGFLGSMIGSPDELTKYIETVKEGVIDEDSSVSNSLSELQMTIKNLSSITMQLDDILKSSSRSINSTLANIEGLTSEVNTNKTSLTNSIQNLESFTAQLDSARVDELITSSNQTINSADRVFTGLEKTLVETNQTVESLKSILSDIETGKGTFGQLVTDRSLYDRMDRVTQNLDLLLQDVRLNPKRYINVSVFGKKQKEYEMPEDDPAFRKD